MYLLYILCVCVCVNCWFLIMRSILYCTKKYTEALEVTNKEIGLEVNAEKTKCMVMYHDQHAGQNHDVTIGYKSFGTIQIFGTAATIQNSIHEEIKSRLKKGKACCHSVQNLLSSSLLSENTDIKIYRTVISLLFYMGVKIGCSR